MFGDAMFDEEDRLRRAADGASEDFLDTSDDEEQDVMALGGLDERLRRRQAIVELLREVGGC